MGQTCSSNQEVSPTSQPITVDYTSPSTNHNLTKPSKENKQVDALRTFKHDEDSHSTCSISTATADPSTNSTDDDQSSIPVTDNLISLHSSSKSSPLASPPTYRDPSHRRDQISITQTYQILPQITGYGVASEVRKCIHRRTSQMYAVKTIAKNQVLRKHWIHREIALLKHMSHPNIVSLYDVYEDENEVNIVMEMCHGGELFDKIAKRVERSKIGRSGGRSRRGDAPPCFREKDAARIVDSLLSAVSYLHSKDVVHRDIKPENVMFAERFDDESAVKLIDFGLSVRHTPKCKPLTLRVGTPHYMAPEVIEGSYDRSCDLWSVGVVAYVMLFGRPPFDGPSKGKSLERPSLDGVSERAKDFIRCLLVVEPKRRWTADMALKHPWLDVTRSVSRPTTATRTKLI